MLFLRFTVFSCLIQYILPLILISLIYTKIYKFLLTRRFQNSTICQKQKRTNCILLSCSLIFLIWLVPPSPLGNLIFKENFAAGFPSVSSAFSLKCLISSLRSGSWSGSPSSTWWGCPPPAPTLSSTGSSMRVFHRR